MQQQKQQRTGEYSCWGVPLARGGLRGSSTAQPVSRVLPGRYSRESAPALSSGLGTSSCSASVPRCRRALLYSTATLPRGVFLLLSQPAPSLRLLPGRRNSRDRAGHPSTAQSERPPLAPRHSGSCSPGLVSPRGGAASMNGITQKAPRRRRPGPICP